MQSFNPSLDFSLIADNLETVTLLRRGRTPGAEGSVIVHALRRAVRSGEFAARNLDESRPYINSDGQCVATDSDWHLPVAELEFPPGIGDVIIDGDKRRWTILEMELVMLQTRWKCFTRELAIAYGLEDTVTILKAEYASGGGNAEPSWRIWRTGIRARIQPVAVKVVVIDSVRSSKETVRIFLEEDVELDHNHRIRGANGSLYEITSITGIARLGELQTVEAVRV
jgi:hypothetical protein